MFTKSAKYYDALYHFKDYSTASKQLHALIQQRNPKATTLLDVACGTGKHLEFLQHNYHVEGLDINPDLLQIACQRCPEVSFHQGDMIHFRLGRTFDVVTCLFSSIAYIKRAENLDKAVASMAHHLRPRGMLFLEPWFGPQNYWVGRTTANFVDQPELKIAWMYTSEIEDQIAILDINYLVASPQAVTYFTERHELGLFTPEEYVGAFQKADLEVFYDSTGLFGRGLYIGIK